MARLSDKKRVELLIANHPGFTAEDHLAAAKAQIEAGVAAGHYRDLGNGNHQLLVCSSSHGELAQMHALAAARLGGR